MKLNKYLIYILPAALVTGPLMADCIIIYLSLSIIWISLKSKSFTIFKNYFSYIFLIFYIILNISAVFSTEPIYALKTSLPYLRYYFFIVAFFYCVKTERKFTNQFLISLICTLVITALSGYAEYFFDITFSLSENYIKHEHRLSGFFGDELILGGYLSRMLPLLIVLIIITKKNNIIYSLGIIVIYFAIFLSGERASLLVGTISFASYIFFSHLKTLQKITILTISILLMVIILKNDKVVNNRMILETTKQIYDNEKIYFFSKEHTTHYKTAIRMFLDKPILGHGPRTFRIVCSDEKFYRNIHSCTSHPHNFLIQLLAEIGIFGVSFFVIFIYSLFKFIRNLSFKFPIAPFYYLPLITFTFPLVPTGNFFNNWLSITCYLSISISLYYLSLNEKKN